MKNILILFLLFFGLKSIAQNDPSSDFDPFYIYENLPKAPEASSLGQYGDITNNPYNGKANVNIPIYSINFAGMQIPIQLSYDSGGVKVNEEASWVGLNWNLSTNFGITQKIYGQNDFDDRQAANNATGGVGFIYSDYSVLYPQGSAPYINQQDLQLIHESYSPHFTPLQNVDMQPDIFDVNIFGNSYKFRLNKQVGSSNIVSAFVFNDKNVIINYNIANESFELIDDKGFIYNFSTKEYATNFTSTPNLINQHSELHFVISMLHI